MDMFEIDSETWEKIKEWQNSFEKKRLGAIGGRFTYMFSPNGLGMVIKVKDDLTGQVKDFTDYDCW